MAVTNIHISNTNVDAVHALIEPALFKTLSGLAGHISEKVGEELLPHVWTTADLNGDLPTQVCASWEAKSFGEYLILRSWVDAVDVDGDIEDIFGEGDDFDRFQPDVAELAMSTTFTYRHQVFKNSAVRVDVKLVPAGAALASDTATIETVFWIEIGEVTFVEMESPVMEAVS